MLTIKKYKIADFINPSTTVIDKIPITVLNICPQFCHFEYSENDSSFYAWFMVNTESPVYNVKLAIYKTDSEIAKTTAVEIGGFFKFCGTSTVKGEQYHLLLIANV
jgi:hypothetical protein